MHKICCTVHWVVYEHVTFSPLASIKSYNLYWNLFHLPYLYATVEMSETAVRVLRVTLSITAFRIAGPVHLSWLFWGRALWKIRMILCLLVKQLGEVAFILSTYRLVPSLFSKMGSQYSSFLGKIMHDALYFHEDLHVFLLLPEKTD